MSDGDKEFDLGEQEGQKKPIHLNEGRRSDRIVNVASNLSAVHQGPSDAPNRQKDIDARENTLGRMGLHNSWFAEEELGGNNTTPWTEILEEAENKDPLRKGAAADFRSTADLARPIYEDSNFKLVQGMSTYEQQAARQKAEDERQAKEKAEKVRQKEIEREEKEAERLARVQARIREQERQHELEEEAEKERLRQKVEEAQALGVVEGQRLAGRVYHSEQRVEVDNVMNSIAEASTRRQGLFGNNGDEVRARVLREIDTSGDLGKSTRQHHHEQCRQKIRKESKRDPRPEEFAELTNRAEAIARDIADIRKFETVGQVKKPPSEITQPDETFRDKARLSGKFYDPGEELEHNKRKLDAWNGGFRGGYESVQDDVGFFMDENRPWYMPTGQSQGADK